MTYMLYSQVVTLEITNILTNTTRAPELDCVPNPSSASYWLHSSGQVTEPLCI
jgi:hypothetical protein